MQGVCYLIYTDMTLEEITEPATTESERAEDV